jgi:hypothetical protein
MDRAEIRARYEETKAYLEAGCVAMEGAEQTARVKAARKMIEHARDALYELGQMLDGEGEGNARE